MDYKLTIYPIMDTSMDAHTTYNFETEKELMAGKNSCADLLLYLQDKLKAMDDESNMFICEKLINGEWEDIND